MGPTWMVAGTWPTWRTYKSKQVHHKLLSELSFQSTCLNLCKYLSELVPHLYVCFLAYAKNIYVPKKVLIDCVLCFSKGFHIFEASLTISK